MRRYIFKLYPTATQADILHEQRKMMADLWNALKQRIEDTYRREGKMLTYYDLTIEIAQLRHECPEWEAIPSGTTRRVAKWLTDSYKAFFRRLRAGEAPGYPRWQRRVNGATIPLAAMSKSGWQLQQRKDNPLSWRLYYKSVTDIRTPAAWIHCRGRLPAIPTDDRRNARRLPAMPVEDWRNADIIWRDKRWWLSVCVEMKSRRAPGPQPTTVEFDLIDCTARVNDMPSWLTDFEAMLAMQIDLSERQAVHATRWPRGGRRDDAAQELFEAEGAVISALSAHLARRRRHSLHVWTARILAGASDLTVIAPPTIRDFTPSPRGDATHWGANVEGVSSLNRLVLTQAPATAITMLLYKAEEAGIRCDVVTDRTPKIVVGKELVIAGKTARRARRKLKEAA